MTQQDESTFDAGAAGPSGTVIDWSKFQYKCTGVGFSQSTQLNKIEFNSGSAVNSWVMRITADRRIEVNEDVEVTEAAKKVLEAMQLLLNAQRPWVGLTDEEAIFLIENELLSRSDLIETIEAKLKEKND